MINERRLSSQGREGLPDSLRNTKSPQRSFDDARDPSLRLQRQAMRKTEKQRRDALGGGSQMVKMDKPFPQLKPRNAQSEIRKTFDRKWAAEQSRAKRDIFDAIDQKHAEREKGQKNRSDFPSRGFGR